MQDLLARAQAVPTVDVHPAAEVSAPVELAVSVSAPQDNSERDSWMERCVELEGQQIEFLLALDAKELELKALQAQILALREATEEAQMAVLIKDDEVLAMRASVEQHEQQIDDVKEALRSREEELYELSGYNEELETKQHVLEQKLHEALIQKVGGLEDDHEVRVLQLQGQLSETEDRLRETQAPIGGPREAARRVES